MDALTTERLLIRPFLTSDLPAVHRILNEAFGANDTETDVRSWLEWSVLSARWFPAMHQFSYGDRAVVLRATDEVIGVAGYVPLLMPFDQIPELARMPGPAQTGQMTPEVGLFWAIAPQKQRQGYATEAGRALVEHALGPMHLWRILATTAYRNAASQAVMTKLGMRLTHNPHAEPEWMQVVGVRYAHEPTLGQEGLLT